MGGNKAKKRKLNASNHDANSKAPKTLPSPPHSDTHLELKNLSTIISDEELEIAVETLQTLTEHPGLIKSKQCKGLRAAVFDFREACTTGANSAADANLTAKISGAITDGKYMDALISLAEMRIRGEAPKLGALCRWVRDLDVISGLDDTNMPARSKTKENLERIRVVDSILRVTGPCDPNFAASDLLSTGPITQKAVWDLHNEFTARLQIRQFVLDGTIFASEEQKTSYRKSFNIIETTPGPQRKPSNLHAAVVYLTAPNSVPLSPAPPQITHTNHPHVPNLSLMQNVLSQDECKSIIAATESIGFLPDAPLTDAGMSSSVLAHNVYWLVDQPFHDALWERVRSCIPERVEGRKARGINRRFRVYRYVPGAEYRAHIDGAWPPSGVDAHTGKYVYDASPATGKQSSLFTFLIYLNDEFEGGETTFFVPSVREGVLNAYPVRPVMGSVCVFPHGETKGALLHEGTGVVKGAKYIIRTDVEFDVEPGLD